MLLRVVILCCVLLGGITLNLCLGDLTVPLDRIWQALTAVDRSEALASMVWQIRLPRLLAAALVGAALAMAGYLLQALSRNQLADPYLTGVSSGAGLAVAIALTTGLGFALIPVAALAGGLAASLLVATMARTATGLSVTKLLLSGVALSAVTGALITMVLVTAQNTARAQGLFYWLLGGISGISWAELLPCSAYVGVGTALAFVFSKPLRLLSLGARQAMSLGLNVELAQWSLLAAAVLMCGAAVSVSGLVGFVGLIAPNIARRLFGSDERLHLASSAATGATLVLFSDLAARTLGHGQELPLGTLLSLLGGPFFLYLVVRHKGEDR